MIREARPRDLDDAARVLREAFEEHRAVHAAVDFDHYLVSLVAQVAEGHLFVACDDTGVVGAGSLYAPGERCHYSDVVVKPWPDDWACLRRLAVLPSHRNRGIAHQLIDARLQRARELGARAVGLHTNFATAQAIYRKLGWQRVAAHDFTLPAAIQVEAFVWSL